MSNELTNKDYIDILTFYKINIPKSKRLIKKHAENIMSDKLCKCIKSVKSKNTKNMNKSSEGRSIGICTKTIFNKKGFTRGKFKCLKNKTVKFRRTNKK